MKKTFLFSIVLFLGLNISAQDWLDNNSNSGQLTTSGPEGVTWDKMEFDFGEMKQHEPETATFTLTNSGKTPIIIEDAKGSCGCTGIEYPKTPILPGKTAVVSAIYDAEEAGTFNKSVTVYLNIQDRVHTLIIKGKVIP